MIIGRCDAADVQHFAPRGAKSGTHRADLFDVTLDEKMFYSIIDKAPPAHGPERRRSYRRPLGTSGTVTRVEDGIEFGSLQVLVTDVSDHGVGMRAPVGLDTGTTHRLNIDAGDAYPPSTIEIVGSRERPDGMFSIGARFV